VEGGGGVSQGPIRWPAGAGAMTVVPGIRAAQSGHRARLAAGTSNAWAEAVNHLIKNQKRQAHGYRTWDGECPRFGPPCTPDRREPTVALNATMAAISRSGTTALTASRNPDHSRRLNGGETSEPLFGAGGRYWPRSEVGWHEPRAPARSIGRPRGVRHRSVRGSVVRPVPGGPRLNCYAEPGSTAVKATSGWSVARPGVEGRQLTAVVAGQGREVGVRDLTVADHTGHRHLPAIEVVSSDAGGGEGLKSLAGAPTRGTDGRIRNGSRPLSGRR